MKLLFLMAACFVAAFVDAIAGGGGLISLPAYIISGIPTHQALGTNKFSSSWGTLLATAKFAKERTIDFALIKSLIPIAFLGAVLGVRTVLSVDSQVLAPLVMILILIVGVYTLFSKNIGVKNHYQGADKNTKLPAMAMVFILGFYDGFFGPGTGTFLVFGFIKLFKFDFLHANAHAKPINLVSNIASQIVFAMHGKILYLYGLPIAVAMMLGGYLGAKTSIRNGNKIIKPLFVIMSLGAFGKLFVQYFG